MLTITYLWVFLLLPLPWIVWAIFPPKKVSEQAIRVPFGERLRAAAGGSSAASASVRNVSSFLIPLLIWVLILLALARPQWLEPPITKNQPTRDLLLLVDLSGSMRQEDFTNLQGEKVDRLTAVKEVLGDFLVRREGDRVGLVVFGDSPYLQAPFSTDLNLSRLLLEECEIGIAGPRTALGDAIGLGINLFEQSDAPAKTIIALTDGNDTRSQVPPVEAARIAKQRDIRIHTVAIGDPTTAGEEKLDEQALRNVSQASGGSYFFAADREELESIYAELDKIETREVNVISHRPRNDLYYWPLLAALLLWMFEKGVCVMRHSRKSALDEATDAGAVRVDPLSGKMEVSG
ncbi:MAG: VWA domain-containing protein [Verrucomicrobiota bacterium]